MTVDGEKVVRYLPRSLEFVFYLVCFIVISTLFFWWRTEAPIVIWERYLINHNVVPGDRLRIENRVSVNNVDCSIKAHRYFIDETDTVFAVVSESDTFEWLVHGQNTFASEVTVPLNVKPGTVEYHVEVVWWCNPLQRLYPTEVKLDTLELFVE